jgi:hypothetical protein
VTRENPQICDRSQFLNAFTLVFPLASMARDLQCPDNQRKLEKQGWLQFGPYEQGLEMEMQRWVCVIDLFGGPCRLLCLPVTRGG